MTIEQTIEIPASHRIFIDVPPEIPAGRTILTFTPAPDAQAAKRRLCNTTNPYEKIENLRGLTKRMGGTFTVEDLFKMRREDLRLEEEKFNGIFGKKE